MKDELTEKGAKLPSNATGDVDKLWNEYSASFPSKIDELFTVIERGEIKCGSCGHHTFSL